MNRRTVLRASAVLVVVLLGLGAWLAVETLRLRTALNDARDRATELSAQVRSSDLGGEAETARELSSSMRTARGITDSPIWWLGRGVPFVGSTYTGLAEAVEALEEVSGEGVRGLTELAEELDEGAVGFRDGRADLSVLRTLAPRVERSAEIFTASQQKFSQIDIASTLGPVRSALTSAREKLESAQAAISKGADVLERAPDMLGAAGPRRYLLVVQNNAELRSTGGIPGAFAELVAVDGNVRIRRQGEGSATGIFTPPALPISAEERALYGTLPGNYWVDTNFSPHFPRTAELLRAMYRTRFDQRIDGVISIDPVALSRILRATGPVQVSPDLALSSENVVPTLLNAVYTDFPTDDDAQNEIFNRAARSIFDTLISGRADVGVLVGELRAATGEGRIIMNATNPVEQELLAGTLLAGELPTAPGPSPNLGLYLNDASASKLGYYLERSSEVKAISCAPDGSQVFQVTTTLRSTVPRNIAPLGPGVLGYTAGANGDLTTVLSYYAPVGGSVATMAVDGRERSVNRKTYRGLELATVPVELSPGASQTLTVTLRSGPGQSQGGVFRTTPGIQVSPNNVTVPSAC